MEIWIWTDEILVDGSHLELLPTYIHNFFSVQSLLSRFLCEFAVSSFGPCVISFYLLILCEIELN